MSDIKILKVIDNYNVVINKGSDDGIQMNQRFLIFRLGEELFDPDTRLSLGFLEIVCGEGKPKHIQERMTTLVTAKSETKTSKRIVRRNGLNSFMNADIEEYSDPEVIDIAFEDVDTECHVKRIK